MYLLGLILLILLIMGAIGELIASFTVMGVLRGLLLAALTIIVVLLLNERDIRRRPHRTRRP